MTDADRLALIAPFVAVAAAGSFAGAAATIELSASTISRRVARLERVLGLRLFERTTRHVALTEAGRIYHGLCHEIFDRLADADATIAAYKSSPRGQLRVSLPLTFGRLHVAPLMRDFMDRYPEIGLEIDFTDRYVDLIDESYDLAVRIGRLADSSLVVRKIATNRQVIVASPDYLRRRGVPLLPGQLTSHECLAFTRRAKSVSTWTLSDGRVSENVQVFGSFRSDNSDAICQAALGGLGIGVLASYISKPHIENGALVPLLESWLPLPTVSIYVAYPSRRYLAPKVRVLADFLVERLRRAPWL